MTRKIKILYISSVIPDTSCGAHIAIYRHFVAKNDFDVTVCSYQAANSETNSKYIIPMSKLRTRLQNTRFSRLLWNLHYFLSWKFIPKELLSFAKESEPDIIMTVPDNIHSGFALQLSSILKKPLVVDLQDLFPLSQLISDYMKPYGLTRRFLLKQFFNIHKAAKLAFYTSEGMKEFFPDHPNGHVLYPIGDFSNRPLDIDKDTASSTTERPFTIVYAGNCYGAYGRMLLKFAKLVKESPELHLKIFPVGKGWSDKDIKIMTEAGIYQKFTPFEELKKELAAADAFLTVMSFEPPEKPFVSTSFTTKWLDYAPYGKPIFVWGPEYSSAYIFAKKHNSGITTTIDDAQELFLSCLQTSKDKIKQNEFGNNALKAASSILNPENIHSVLVNQISRLLNQAN